MRTWQRMHAIFPRIAALSESAWSPSDKKDYADFLSRLPAQLPRYRAFGIDYAKTPFEVLASAGDDRAAGTVRVALENPLGYAIRYTTDGSDPDADSPLYEAPVDGTLPIEIRAAAFAGTTPLGPASRHAFDAASLLVRTDEQLATCPDTGRLLLRLEDDGPIDGERAIFNVTIFYPCWLWADANLDGIGGLQVRLGRLPYYFQLAHDEPARRFMPAETAHGELLVQAGGCNGETVAGSRCPHRPPPMDSSTSTSRCPMLPAAATMCFTCHRDDTRPAMWVLDRVGLVHRR